MHTALRPRYWLLLICTLLALVLPVALPIGCGPQPVGVDACRKIESARCDAALTCISGFTETDVADCKLVYHDQCLHGIENADERPTDSETDACVAAIAAADACAKSGVDGVTAETCPGALLVADAPARKPCDVIVYYVHELQACAFVEAQPDDSSSTGTSTDTTTTTDTGDAGTD